MPEKDKVINFKQKFDLFSDLWSPKVIAELNDYQFKLAKVKGDFVWHNHRDTDEAFIVIQGSLRIDFKDHSVTINQGEMYIVPKGIDHKPFAENEVQIMLIEPKGVVNTGDKISHDKTAKMDVWI